VNETVKDDNGGLAPICNPHSERRRWCRRVLIHERNPKAPQTLRETDSSLEHADCSAPDVFRGARVGATSHRLRPLTVRNVGRGTAFNVVVSPLAKAPFEVQFETSSRTQRDGCP
jgi:hypothetical protein